MQPAPKIACPICSSANIRKYGVRKNQLQSLQKYQCKSCKKIFTLQTQSKGKTYPIRTILKAISLYNLGCSQTTIVKKLKLGPSQKTISNWINKYKHLLTYNRLRKQAIKQYNPKNIIKKQTLNHIQPYTFQYHKAKLSILVNENKILYQLKNYILKINKQDYPHHIFIYHNEDQKNTRASQIKFPHLKIIQTSKTNLANKLAKLALNLAKSNRDRHQSIQNFFLINDSTTIAVELPIYLTNWGAGYYRNQKGFIFPLNHYKTPITGHIDILQIRNSLLHILDYKPDAHKQQPIKQLTLYAMALSRKLNLPLYHFKCAWFDENNYYEFYPLHAVYPRNH